MGIIRWIGENRAYATAFDERKLRMNGNIEVHSGLLSVLLNDDCQKR